MATSNNIGENRELVASNKIDGSAVYNLDGQRLGTISNFVIDKVSGKTEYAVLQPEGLLRSGIVHYSIPSCMLQYDIEHSGYVIDLSKEQLDDAYRLQGGQPSLDAAYDAQFFGHYGLPY